MRTKPSRVNGVAARQIGGYLRVSSKSQTAMMQRDAIERAASARGDVVAEWYEDRLTGGGRHPPELVRLLEHARQGQLAKLYVYRLDRLGRRGIRDLLGIVHELEQCGVELVTVADGFSLDGPARDVVIAVIAWAAQMERLAIGERIADARRRIESKGGAWGRPRRVFDLERAKAMQANGRSMRQISKALGVPKATMARALKLSQKGGTKWCARALAKNKLRKLKKKGIKVDLRKTSRGTSQ
jgi:DNA invertase Pin-like site-specific DNA recombinase